MVASSIGMLTRQPAVVESLGKAEVPDHWYPGLAALKMAGAVGLIVGLWVPAIGIAAAAGLVLYFIGAAVFHVRAGDRNIAPPAILAVVSLAALVLRAASA
jgi:uncharacterized membrane protein